MLDIYLHLELKGDQVTYSVALEAEKDLTLEEPERVGAIKYLAIIQLTMTGELDIMLSNEPGSREIYQAAVNEVSNQLREAIQAMAESQDQELYRLFGINGNGNKD